MKCDDPRFPGYDNEASYYWSENFDGKSSILFKRKKRFNLAGLCASAHHSKLLGKSFILCGRRYTLCIRPDMAQQASAILIQSTGATVANLQWLIEVLQPPFAMSMFLPAVTKIKRWRPCAPVCNWKKSLLWLSQRDCDVWSWSELLERWFSLPSPWLCFIGLGQRFCKSRLHSWLVGSRLPIWYKRKAKAYHLDPGTWAFILRRGLTLRDVVQKLRSGIFRCWVQPSKISSVSNKRTKYEKRSLSFFILPSNRFSAFNVYSAAALVAVLNRPQKPSDESICQVGSFRRAALEYVDACHWIFVLGKLLSNIKIVIWIWKTLHMRSYFAQIKRNLFMHALMLLSLEMSQPEIYEKSLPNKHDQFPSYF